MFKTLIISAAVSALLFGGTTAAWAHPHSGATRPGTSGTTGLHNPAGKDDSVAQLPFTDREFLRASAFDDEPRPLQDAAIALARAQCEYLDKAGNTAANRTYLAEESRPFVEYPYLFLQAAVGFYCPRHSAGN
ncbi:DUF732 domain-containing protein [Nocardia flavorosea]|uniref:DUF732 domain-containing protein n=1 Tax=Nocardia flavorosea TaxID=53429 RepID=A0A846YEW4_9NOCA|nr:hypothetical protein [Nocardia flavorosea]NKY55359.1 hypothetical protein [Nocardia flavorosea]